MDAMILLACLLHLGLSIVLFISFGLLLARATLSRRIRRTKTRRYVPAAMPKCTVLTMVKLPFTQKFIDTKTVYGDPEECKKVTAPHTERVNQVDKNPKFHKWTDEFGCIPTKAHLTEKFGKMHYGWAHKDSLEEPEKVSARLAHT